jgi:hypothetical protein
MANRRKKDDRRKDDLIAERQSRVRGFLKDLGIWERLKNTNVADTLLRCHFPRIAVSLHEAVPATDETSAILKALRKVIDAATIPYPPFGDKFPIVDLISFVLPMMKVFQVTSTSDPDLAPHIERVKKQLDPRASSSAMSLAVHNVFRHLDDELAKFCRIDTKLYCLKLHAGWSDQKKWTTRFEVRAEPIRQRTVTTESGPRPAYWCGQPFGDRGIDWVQWPRSFLGGDDREPPLPVFVQGHALDNLYRHPERGRLRFIEDGDWMIHDYLWQSLREPVITPIARQPGKYLVVYRLNMHKLGYLVVRRVDDVVLVETFLFLTMDGTPEGDALWRKLCLARRDKELLELDKIRTFLMTDVQFDKELVEILEECGCGHLFKVVREQPRERYVPGYAEEMRKYLRLDV